jgi:NADH:ubiquinone oxidoreductase subunit E
MKDCQKNNIHFWENRKGERKMKITVCIGSSCHIKGSRQVVERLQELLDENHLNETVDLAGTFCLGQCQLGVCVTVDDVFFSVTPDTVDEFFQNEVLAKVCK